MKEYKILIYRIQDQYFGTDAEEIAEIADYKTVKENELVKLSYLGDYLGLNETNIGNSSKKVILIDKNKFSREYNGFNGFIVDDVIQILNVPETKIHNAPKILLTKENKFLDKFCIDKDKVYPIVTFQ